MAARSFAARASASSSRSSSTRMIISGSSRSLSPIVTPARSSRYSARPTGFFSVWYASFNARDRDSAATRSAAGALANRSGCHAFERSKKARSIAAASRSNCAGRPSSSKAPGELALELDGLSTAALALGVRVVELEPVPHEVAHEVELHPAEVHEALRIDDDRRAVRRELLVGRAERVGPLEHVREAGAAAAAHADADA